MDELAILRVMHGLLKHAGEEWLGVGGRPNEDLQWVQGVVDMTTEMLKETNDEDRNGWFDDQRKVEN